MRELKFRAFRKHKNSTGDMDYSDRWVSLSEFFEHLEVNYPDAIIMQDTGIKDESGYDLYFDDTITMWYGARSQFNTFRNIEILEDVLNLLYDINEHGASFEIVGNIHSKSNEN